MNEEQISYRSKTIEDIIAEAEALELIETKDTESKGK